MTAEPIIQDKTRAAPGHSRSLLGHQRILMATGSLTILKPRFIWIQIARTTDQWIWMAMGFRITRNFSPAPILRTREACCDCSLPRREALRPESSSVLYSG